MNWVPSYFQAYGRCQRYDSELNEQAPFLVGEVMLNNVKHHEVEEGIRGSCSVWYCILSI